MRKQTKIAELLPDVGHTAVGSLSFFLFAFLSVFLFSI